METRWRCFGIRRMWMIGATLCWWTDPASCERYRQDGNLLRVWRGRHRGRRYGSPLRESGEQWCIHAVSLSGKQRTVYCGTAPTRILDVASSGRALVSTEESRGTMAIVEHGSNQERDLSWLSYSWGPRLSRDGSEMLFTDLSEESGNDYSVYVRKSDGSPAVRLAGGGYATDITPDGKWAMVILPDDPARASRLCPWGRGRRASLHWDGIQPRWAEWFPDGHRILTARQPVRSGGGCLSSRI